MFKFRRGLSPHQTALAMVGAKAGQTVYIVSDGTSGLAGEVARVTGLNGRTVASGLDGAAGPALEAAAADAGALVEVVPPFQATLTATDGLCDIVVLEDVLARVANPDVLAGEAHRILRPGGRAVIVVGRAARGWFAGRGADALAADGTAARASLERAGFRATRILGASDGVAYVEGVK